MHGGMVGAFRKLLKLRRIGADELGVRGRQALAALYERSCWSPLVRLPEDTAFVRRLVNGSRFASAPTPQSLCEGFRNRKSPVFFASFDDRAQTMAALRSRWPDAEQQVIARAEKIRDGRFDLLGWRDVSFGKPIDWHLDPVQGRRAPLIHWSRIRYTDPEVAGDKKLIWELNRHQHFAALGMAYWYTGDERYTETFVGHLTSWMDANPPKLGINWASSLEVAFRAISWIWGLYFFRHSERLDPSAFLRAYKFLYLHGRHLETYLSTYFSPNTHLTGEALGLFYLGLLLPELSPARRWRELGASILLDQLDRHVRSDGTYFEQSTYYHRYTTDFYAHFWVLSERNGLEVDQRVKDSLSALLDHLMFVTKPDGSTPLIGDDDGGRLMPLDRRPADDFRATLSTGAALLRRGDFAYVAGEAAEETGWLLGPAGVERFDALAASPPSSESRAFDAGGFYVMRDGWVPRANYLLINCGPHGSLSCGHAHADALSFELAANGTTFLVDPGSYTYTGSAELRELFRSSAWHNTLTIEGESSSLPGDTFSWKHVANCECTEWISAGQFDFFSGRHDGYSRMRPAASHARAMLFLKGRYWAMVDYVHTGVDRRVESWFHFAPGIVLEIDARGGLLAAEMSAARSARSGLSVCVADRNGSFALADGWASRLYGSRTSAPVAKYCTNIAGGTELVTLLIPWSGSAPAFELQEDTGSGVRVVTIRTPSHEDRFIVAGSEGVTSSDLACDSRIVWLRLSSTGRSLQELVMIGGSYLDFRSEAIVRSDGPVRYFAARRSADRMLVDTDSGSALSFSTLEAGRVFVNGVAVRTVSGDGVCDLPASERPLTAFVSPTDEAKS